MNRSPAIGWSVLALLLLAAAIVPFLVAGARMEAWTGRFLDGARAHPLASAATMGLLLSLDILLPVPSSIVSTAAGGILGFAGGAAVTFAGMTASCAIGYLIGAGPGRVLARGALGTSEAVRLDRISRRLGDWVVVVCRPVPVLAEASVLFVAMGRMPWRRFALLSALANAGIAIVYAAAGALARTANASALAFLAAVGVPALAMFLARERRTPRG